MATKNAGKNSGGASMKVDTKLVRELAEMLDETGLSEIEVEDGDRKVRVSRAMTAAAAPAVVASPAPVTAAPEPLAAPAAEAGAAAAPANAVPSPMVGTAYLAAEHHLLAKDRK